MILEIPSDALDQTLQRVEELRPSHPDGVAPPSREDLAQLVDTVLWAGIKKEEGRELSFAVAYLARDDCRDDERIVFAKAMPVDPRSLARIAPALQRRRSRLGIHAQDGELRAWGITQRIPTCVKIRALSPGIVAVKYGRENVTIVEPPAIHHVAGALEDSIKLIEESLASAKEEPLKRIVFTGVLLMVIEAVRRHGNGGTVLVVPDTVPSIPHLEPGRLDQGAPAAGLAKELKALWDQARDKLAREPKLGELETALQIEPIKSFLSGDQVDQDFWRKVTAIGQLSAIDGAVVIGTDFRLRDFGARIVDPPSESTGIEYFEGEVGDRERKREPHPTTEPLGGTRHRSALSFVQRSPGTVALVASHDGPLTVIAAKPDGKLTVTKHIERLID